MKTRRSPRPRPFNPLRSNRAEFYAFFLFSLTGLMLCASADDLIWLFLALELTSLPTYIMVTISMQRGEAESRSQEAGVKYFFLGALGVAIFLYGFALIYGATGTTNLPEIAAALATPSDRGRAQPDRLRRADRGRDRPVLQDRRRPHALLRRRRLPGRRRGRLRLPRLRAQDRRLPRDHSARRHRRLGMAPHRTPAPRRAALARSGSSPPPP